MRINRDKLLHAIVFFVENTHWCHKVKLFKLLYFLDFEIYRQTGKSTTGLPYDAWPMGPVPSQLQDEFRSPPQDMRSVLVVRDTPDRLFISPRVKFDESHFTPRELKEMERLAFVFKEARAEDIKLASHAVGLPWHQVYEVEGRHQAPIPYDLALTLDKRPDTVTKEWADEIALEARAAAALFK
jgi:uncharacterized phage-associated protein